MIAITCVRISDYRKPADSEELSYRCDNDGVIILSRLLDNIEPCNKAKTNNDKGDSHERGLNGEQLSSVAWDACTI